MIQNLKIIDKNSLDEYSKNYKLLNKQNKIECEDSHQIEIALDNLRKDNHTIFNFLI